MAADSGKPGFEEERPGASKRTLQQDVAQVSSSQQSAGSIHLERDRLDWLENLERQPGEHRSLDAVLLICSGIATGAIIIGLLVLRSYLHR